MAFIGAVVVTAGAVYTAVLLTSEARHLSHQAEDAHWTSARHLAHACGESLTHRDELTVINFFKELEKSADFVEGACVDAEGLSFLHSDLRRSGEKIAAALPVGDTRRDDGRRRTYLVPIRRGDRSAAAAVLTIDRERAARRLRELLSQTARRSLGGAGGVLILALGLSWLAAGALTRPIVALESGVRRVAGGDWRARVDDGAPGELGRLARAFNDMSRQLGELDRLKDQFVHTASHDLRNPLSAIATVAQALKTDDLSAESRSLVDLIETSVVRLNAMVNNLLDTARLREGRLTFHVQPLAAGDLMRDLVRLYGPLARETRKSLTLEIPADLPPVKADEEKVMRIFLNLLSNALKFTREGDRVTLSADRGESGFLRFAVADTGWGIPPEQRAKLFQPFQSTDGAVDGARRAQGTGLGLSITKALVEGHGGSLTVDSEPDRGTTFRFTLPLAPEGAR
jgi:signal transduction histidine kinase